MYNIVVLSQNQAPRHFFPLADDSGGNIFFTDCNSPHGNLFFYAHDLGLDDQRLFDLNIGILDFWEYLKPE